MAEKGKEAVNQDIRSLILSDAMKRQFALALPKHLTPDRFVRIALTAINKTPKLMECTKESLLACLLDCSQLGLEPDGRKAHLIPYGNKCTLIIDYKGLVALARRSGEIADIHADIVCENDEFKYSFGTEGMLAHKPCLKDRGETIAAYSFVKLKDGSSSYEVMNIEEIEAIHKRSKAGKEGPWITDWAEMAKKTVFRRHSKWLPVSSEFQEAIEKDFDVPIDIIPTMKPVIEIPQAIKPGAIDDDKESTEEKTDNVTPKKSTNFELLGQAGEYKKSLGEGRYYQLLYAFKVNHANELSDEDLKAFIVACKVDYQKRQKALKKDNGE